MKDRPRVLATAAVLVTVAALLAGCSSPAEKVHEFAIWAADQAFVTSVDAEPMSGELGDHGLIAHLAVDAGIGNDELVSLASAVNARVSDLDISYPEIFLLVGDAWGFSLYDDANVGVINQLRNNAQFVGATLEYQPLNYTGKSTGGLRGTVAAADDLVMGCDALVAVAQESLRDLSHLAIIASAADESLNCTTQ